MVLFSVRRQVAKKNYKIAALRRHAAPIKVSTIMIDIYVINLPEAKERLFRMHETLSALGVKYKIIPAVKGKDWMESTGIKPFSTILHKYLSPGEVGCYLSHKKAWKEIMNSSKKFGVVLEDDAVFGDELLDFLEQLNNSSLDFDIIHVENVVKNNQSFLTSSDSCVSFEQTKIYRLFSPSIATGVMIVSKAGAQKLLHLTDSMYEPADEIVFNIYSSIRPKLIIYQTQKVLAWQNFQLSPEVQKLIPQGISKGKVNRKTASAALHGIKKLFKKINYLFSTTLIRNKEWIKMDPNQEQQAKLAVNYLHLLEKTMN